MAMGSNPSDLITEPGYGNLELRELRIEIEGIFGPEEVGGAAAEAGVVIDEAEEEAVGFAKAQDWRLKAGGI